MEAAVVDYLRAFFPAAQRARGPGEDADRGDVTGVDGWTIEVKDQAVLKVPEWWRQTLAAAARTGCRPWLIAKRKGVADVGESYTVWRTEDAALLVRALADAQARAERYERALHGHRAEGSG